MANLNPYKIYKPEESATFRGLIGEVSLQHDNLYRWEETFRNSGLVDQGVIVSVFLCRTDLIPSKSFVFRVNDAIAAQTVGFSTDSLSPLRDVFGPEDGATSFMITEEGGVNLYFDPDKAAVHYLRSGGRPEGLQAALDRQLQLNLIAAHLLQDRRWGITQPRYEDMPKAIAGFSKAFAHLLSDKGSELKTPGLLVQHKARALQILSSACALGGLLATQQSLYFNALIFDITKYVFGLGLIIGTAYSDLNAIRITLLQSLGYSTQATMAISALDQLRKLPELQLLAFEAR